MKVIGWSIVMLSLVSCATVYRPLLTKSTEQPWAGGVKGNKGTNYYIELDSTEPIQIDSLYFQDNCFRLDTNSHGSNAYYLVNDQLYRIVVNLSNANHSRGDKTPPTTNEPCPTPTFNGEAMITFRHNDKRDTLVIYSFEQLPRLVYP